jgi:hypothetical protein
MRNFTDTDLQPWAGHFGLFVESSELVDAPLPWQLQGLSQTASGYGMRLTTSRKIQFNGRLYRLYCTQYSNAGSVWFVTKGRKVFVN